MKELRPIFSSRVAVLLGTFALLLSCQPKRDFFGTYSYCNEEGYYVEVSFLSADELLIAHELVPDGRQYRYRLEGDTMITYDLEGRLLTKCGIAKYEIDQVIIVAAQNDSTYEFIYSRIASKPILGEAFKDTTDTGYKEYLALYLERKMKKGCPPIRPPARINIQDMDTVFNNF